MRKLLQRILLTCVKDCIFYKPSRRKLRTKGSKMHISGTILIFLSAFIGGEAGPWVFAIGLCMVGFWLGMRFAEWDQEKGGKR